MSLHHCLMKRIRKIAITFVQTLLLIHSQRGLSQYHFQISLLLSPSRSRESRAEEHKHPLKSTTCLPQNCKHLFDELAVASIENVTDIKKYSLNRKLYRIT